MMNLFLRTLTGSNISVDVEMTDTVADLKRAISKKYGYAVPEQRLILCGVIMDDTKTLESYKVQKETVVHFVIHSDQDCDQDCDRHDKKRCRIEPDDM
jgi:hypothetical protein